MEDDVDYWTGIDMCQYQDLQHILSGKRTDAEWDLRNVANTREQAEEVARRVRNLAKNEDVQRNISVRVEGGSMDIYKLVVKAE